MTTWETEQVAGKGLRPRALGLVRSVVVGIASTAPAYSLAASLGLRRGHRERRRHRRGQGAARSCCWPSSRCSSSPSPTSELNKAEPDCGTTFTWAARAFGPRTGWMGGWGIIAADVIVMANLAQIAGSYSFTLRRARLTSAASDAFWSTVAGVVWIVVMTYICYRGIEVSARLQYALLGIEVVVLVIFARLALIKVYTGNATEPDSLMPSLSLALARRA